MPRPNTGPRLVFYRPKNYAKKLYFVRWYERGQRRERAVGADDREAAERRLVEVIDELRAARPIADAGPVDVGKVTVASILAFYGYHRAPQAVDSQRIGHAIEALLPFWGDRTVDTIVGKICRQYYAQRRTALAKKFPRRAARALPSPVDKKGPAAFDGTIRRELGTLAAALKFCKLEGQVKTAPDVWLPPKRPARERWLTREQAARLIRAARKDKRSRGYLPLFVLTGLYMAQRKDAILSLQWVPNFTGGWVDLEQGVIHWKADMEVESNKRRPKAPIPKRLYRFLSNARSRTRQYVFERSAKGPDGRPRLMPINNIKHSFATAACNAGLGTLENKAVFRKSRGKTVRENVAHTDVTPHILRHTGITWMLQRGAPIREVAGFVGATEQVIEDIYGHHHPDHLRGARTALD